MSFSSGSADTVYKYGGNRIWQLTISAVPDPDSILIAGEAAAPSIAAAAVGGEGGTFLLSYAAASAATAATKPPGGSVSTT